MGVHHKVTPIIEAACIAAFFLHNEKLKGAPNIDTYHVAEIKEKHSKIHFEFADNVFNI